MKGRRTRWAGLVRLAFSCFAASSIALAEATVCYRQFAFGWIRGRRVALAGAGGPMVTTSAGGILPMTEGIGRFGTMLAWYAVVFPGLSILLRSMATGRLPLSNMHEFSKRFNFLVLPSYPIFERWYGVRQVGTIVMPVATGMAL